MLFDSLLLNLLHFEFYRLKCENPGQIYLKEIIWLLQNFMFLYTVQKSILPKSRHVIHLVVLPRLLEENGKIFKEEI